MLRVAMFGELARGADERGAVRRRKGAVGPVIVVVVAVDRRGPVLVQRQVEALERHAFARQIGEGRAVEIGAEALVPRGPVERGTVPAWGAAVVDRAALVIRDA